MFEFSSSPVASVQSAVLDGFGDVRDGQMFGSFQVGDGARDLEDAIVGAGGETLLCMARSSRRSAVGTEFAVVADLPRASSARWRRSSRRTAWKRSAGRSRAAMTRLRISAEPSGGCAAAQLLILHGRNLDVDVDAVEQRPGDLRDVALDHRRRAHALARLVVEIAARTRIHGGDEHEAGGKAERHGGARDGDRVVFQRLAHHLQHVARKLGQLVQKEDAVVGQADLAGAGDDAAADQAGVGDGVVRRAEGAG